MLLGGVDIAVKSYGRFHGPAAQEQLERMGGEERGIEMAKKDDLCNWAVEALRESNGRASIVDVCKYIWKHHEAELRTSGDLFFTWQYHVGWAATQLRKERVMRGVESSPKGIWELR